ncbi:hypothetical protein MRX96_059594 [Rhipicephalus microplus]
MHRKRHRWDFPRPAQSKAGRVARDSKCHHGPLSKRGSEDRGSSPLESRKEGNLLVGVKWSRHRWGDKQRGKRKRVRRWPASATKGIRRAARRRAWEKRRKFGTDGKERERGCSPRRTRTHSGARAMLRLRRGGAGETGVTMSGGERRRRVVDRSGSGGREEEGRESFERGREIF